MKKALIAIGIVLALIDSEVISLIVLCITAAIFVIKILRTAARGGVLD